MRIRKGDIVARKSYGKDIIFIVDRLIKLKNGETFALLKGATIRIEADAYIEDLEKVDVCKLANSEKQSEEILLKRIKKNRSEYRNYEIKTGKILHLDGDKRYSQKSANYYRKMGLNAIVKNIPENKQPFMVRQLLERYKPDILIITGHDAMLKKGTNYANIYNYRNSRNFVETVKEARKWTKSSKNLVIFAGACQSFFEAIIEAGADFASSPGRILIDFIDPIIVAEKIATTDNNRFISGYEIAREIKEGEKGIGGIGAMGKKKKVTIM